MSATERHPKGLYVLFATEMWERFSFYSMLAMFTLYVQDPAQGFGWSRERATGLYANYMACVYLSPLIGGWLADRKLGYRRAVMVGALFFMAGHLLLSFHSTALMYTALACLVTGNGFFKPNVTTMVGNLYAEDSPLKDRAYNIFYMGINVGAFVAPLVAEYTSSHFGLHVAFAVAAGGMLLSLGTLWRFKHLIEGDSVRRAVSTAPQALDGIPDHLRIFGLLGIFLIVIVFFMAFSQNGTTMTYFANENIDWNVSGIVANAINPFWIIALTFPLIALWKTLARRGLEPSTPAKMALGMLFTGLAFFIMAWAGHAGGNHGKVSPWWLIGAYFVLSTGELMLSPMGLSLVSKVAPARMRALMMGGWFLATGLGNKLTMIGVLWDDWLHSTFFALIGAIAFGVGLLLLCLLKPLQRAMPGV